LLLNCFCYYNCLGGKAPSNRAEGDAGAIAKVEAYKKNAQKRKREAAGAAGPSTSAE
tara:strand:+ start:429 stop:599 length:171 start_codon:yes stop_codon:yes gene_type:complete